MALYNLTGANGKRCLNDLKYIMNFLRKLLSKWYPNVSKEDYTQVIQNYIKTVSARIKKTNEETFE